MPYDDDDMQLRQQNGKIMERRVKDSIYPEYISFTEDLWKYIDNPHYQRLRNLQ